MSYIGDFRLGETFDIKFTTRTSAGVPFALASGVISAYPGNSTTQLTAGITLTADFDTVTGLNNIRVVATTANGYLTATNYQLVITTGTVNSVSVVGEVVGQFSIENRSSADLGLSIRSKGTLDAGDVGSFTLPSGQRTGVVAGQARILITSGAAIGESQVIASYNSGTGVGAPANVFANDPDTATYIVFSIPAGVAFTAADFGTGCIDADAVAADAVTEIQSGLATQTSVNTIDDFLDTEIAAIKAKTDSLTFTVAGKVDANITHVIADPIVASSAKTTNWGGTA